MDNMDRATDSFERSFLSSFPSRNSGCDRCSKSCDHGCGCHTTQGTDKAFSPSLDQNSQNASAHDTPPVQSEPSSNVDQVPTIENDTVFPTDAPIGVPPSLPKEDYLRDPFRDDARKSPHRKTDISNRYINNSASAVVPQMKINDQQRKNGELQASTMNRYVSRLDNESTAAELSSQSTSRQLGKITSSIDVKRDSHIDPNKPAVFVSEATEEATSQTGVVRAAAMMQLTR